MEAADTKMVLHCSVLSNADDVIEGSKSAKKETAIVITKITSPG